MRGSHKHLAILLPDLRGGGAERVSVDLAHEFASRGHKVEFVLMRAEGEFLTEVEAAFSVVDLGISRSRRIPTALAAYLRTHQPDALLAAMWPLTVLAVAARALSGQRCQLVLSEHALLSLQYSDWGWRRHLLFKSSMWLGYRLTDALVAVSTGVAQDMARLAGIPIEQIKVVHNPVPSRPDPSIEAMAQSEASWTVPKGARILTVGSFKKVKNHSLLLHAIALLPEAVGVRLMLLGKGEEESALRALVNELGLAERVIFAGFHSDPTPFYRTADLFVLSSDHEGFGNVIVEALAAGTPVVSTDCPSGPSEILAAGEFGRLVPVKDPAALANAMLSALAEPTDREALRARANYFSAKRSADQYLKLLLPKQQKAGDA